VAELWAAFNRFGADARQMAVITSHTTTGI